MDTTLGIIIPKEEVDFTNVAKGGFLKTYCKSYGESIKVYTCHCCLNSVYVK